MEESRLKKMLDASPDMYLVIDGNGTLIDFKPSVYFKPIMPPGEFLGKHVQDVLPAEIAVPALINVKEVLETGKEGAFEYSLPTEGIPHFFEVRFTIFAENQVLAIIRDVTDRNHSIQAAQTLINASEDWFFLLDRQGYIMSINQSAAEIFGKRREQMEGTLYWDHLAPGKVNPRKERLEEVLRTGELTKIVHRSDGRIYEASLNPLVEPSGAVNFVAYFINDITDQVNAEQELIESEARHRRLFDENPVPMYIYDTETLKILDANSSLINNYGYTLEELITMTIGDIRPAEDVSRVMENVTDLRSKQVHLGLWRHTKKDGSVIDVEITSGDFPYENKPARLVLCYDVTEKVRIQRSLAEREEEYRLLFENNPLPMMIIDPVSMELLNVNNATVGHYGYAKTEFLSMTIKDFRPPEDVKGGREVDQVYEFPD